MGSASVWPPAMNRDDETVLVQLPLSSPRPSLTVMVPRCAVMEPAETDTAAKLTVVLGTVMLIDPPVRVKVVVVVPVVAAPATPERTASSRVAPTRAVRPARNVLTGAAFLVECIPVSLSECRFLTRDGA